MSLAQGNNTPTRPRIEPGSPDSESDALTTRPARPRRNINVSSCETTYRYLEIQLKVHLKKHKAKKKNSCVSGSPTDPKISWPTLDFFFSKKKKSKKKKFFFFFFFSFIQSPHTHKFNVVIIYYHCILFLLFKT